MKRGLIGLSIVLAVVAGAAVAAVLWIQRYMQTPLQLDQPLIVTIEAGSGLNSVSRTLAQRGAVAHPRAWSWYARYKRLGTRIHAGEYEFLPGATPAGILDQMVRGEVVLRSLTVVEGTGYRDFLRALAAHASVKHTLGDVGDEDLMARIGVPGVHPEGQFFPDTYRFASGTTDLEILKRAHAELEKRLTTAWSSRAKDLALQDPYQALILASMVEKETGLPTERPLIAGVFVHRLGLGMRLQSDPTVIYGLGAAYDGDIRSRDLRGDTPYNTYTRDGLPPTPIALVGDAALRAATQPNDTGAVFFVASGRGDGSHTFSKTLGEHSAAVRTYLARTRGQR